MLKHKPLHQTNSGTSHQSSEISSSKLQTKKKVIVTRSHGDKPINNVTRKNSVKTGPSFDIDRNKTEICITSETRTSSTSTSFFMSPASSRRSIVNLNTDQDNKSIQSSSKIVDGLAPSSGYAGSNLSSVNLEHDISSDEFQDVSLLETSDRIRRSQENKNKPVKKSENSKLSKTANVCPDVRTKRDKSTHEKQLISKKVNQFLVPDSSNQDSKLKKHLISKEKKNGGDERKTEQLSKKVTSKKHQNTPLSGSDSDSELELQRASRRSGKTTTSYQQAKLRKDHSANRIPKSKNLQDLRSSKVLSDQKRKSDDKKMLKYRNSGIFNERPRIRSSQQFDQDSMRNNRRRFHSDSSESIVSNTSSSGLASAINHQIEDDLLHSKIEKLRTILMMLNPGELYHLVMARLDNSYQDPSIIDALSKLLPNIDIDHLMDNLSASENSENEHIEHNNHQERACFEQRREMQRLPIKFSDGQEGFIRREKCITTASSTSRSGRSSPIDNSSSNGSNLYHLPVNHQDNNSTCSSDYHDPGVLEQQALQQLVQHTFSKMTIEDSDGTGIGTEISSITRTSSYLMDMSNNEIIQEPQRTVVQKNKVSPSLSHTLPPNMRVNRLQESNENLSPRQYMEEQMANYKRVRKTHAKAKTCISDSGSKNSSGFASNNGHLTPQNSCVPNFNMYAHTIQSSSSILMSGHQGSINSGGIMSQSQSQTNASSNTPAKKLKITHCVRCHKNYDQHSSSTVLNKCRIPHPQNLVIKLENNSNDFKCIACKKTFRLPLAMDYYEESTNSIMAGFCYDGSHTNDPTVVEYNSVSQNGTAKTCEENGCVEFYV